MQNDQIIVYETFKKSKKCEVCLKKGAYQKIDPDVDICFCYEHLCEAYEVVILDSDDDKKDGYFFPNRCVEFGEDEYEHNCTYQQLMFDAGYVLTADLRYMTRQEAENEGYRKDDIYDSVDTLHVHPKCNHGGDYYADPELTWLEKMEINKAIRILVLIPANGKKQRQIVDEVSRRITGN